MKIWSLALLALCGCAVINPSMPSPKAMTLHEYSDSAIARQLWIADGSMRGTVEKVENDWEYDIDCHFPSQLQGCRNQYAWKISIRDHKDQLWAFPIPGQYLPVDKGMQAIFLYTNNWIVPFSKCNRMGMLANACFQTNGLEVRQLMDTLDILPLSDSTRVDSLRKVLRHK